MPNDKLKRLILNQQLLGFRSVKFYIAEALYRARVGGLPKEDINALIELRNQLTAHESNTLSKFEELHEKLVAQEADRMTFDELAEKEKNNDN